MRFRVRLPKPNYDWSDSAWVVYISKFLKNVSNHYLWIGMWFCVFLCGALTMLASVFLYHWVLYHTHDPAWGFATTVLIGVGSLIASVGYACANVLEERR